MKQKVPIARALVHDPPLALRARWVFPVEQPPIADGLVTIQGGRILAVGENLSGNPPRELGHVALLPGLVNAHTHLEFSLLDRPLGAPHLRFADWIGRVVAYRREQAAAGERAFAVARRHAIGAGLRESLHHGTTLLGEIATEPWSAAPLVSDAPDGPETLAGVVFHELLGLGADRIDTLREAALQHIQSHSPDDPRALPNGWTRGLSPHAPYTVRFDFLRELVSLSARRRFPLTMHLAETPEELELLGSHAGPLVERLRAWEAWDASGVPRGVQPADYLEQLARADRALVIHGNYLTDGDHQLLARHAERMSVVYCPRTHARFGHGRYPLPEMLAAGVRVALGTDSRASNPDLNLLSELRFVARRFPEVEGSRLLRLATLAGAEALGRAADHGSIAVGKRADFAIVGLPDRQVEDPHCLLWEETEGVREVIRGGRIPRMDS